MNAWVSYIYIHTDICLYLFEFVFCMMQLREALWVRLHVSSANKKKTPLMTCHQFVRKFSSNEPIQANTEVCNYSRNLIYFRLIPRLNLFRRTTSFFFFFLHRCLKNIYINISDSQRCFHAPACYVKTWSLSKLQQKHEIEEKPHSKYRGDSAAPEDERCTSSTPSGTVCGAHFAAAQVTNRQLRRPC